MQKQASQSAVNPATKAQRLDKSKEALKRLSAIKNLSPRELYDQLRQMGYVGQQTACRKLCLMAYRHIRRLKDHYLSNIPLEKLPQKSNVLMTGPTGCGKTYLAELLFGQILEIPVATVDMTGYVETGYMGKYVSGVLFDLQNAAEGNHEWAKMGICILDEFDKINGAGSNVRFGGEGTTKDVSGYGVQRSLLKLIEGGKHKISNKGPLDSHSKDYLKTDCIGFVACGAFTGIEEMAVNKHGSNFGFKTSCKGKQDEAIAYELSADDVVSVEIFSRYGFLPELIGRFSSIVYLNPLGKNDLKYILKKNVLPKYRKEFKREGHKLTVPNKVLEDIIEKAMERKTGARGLSLLLTEYFENQAFELFG